MRRRNITYAMIHIAIITSLYLNIGLSSHWPCGYVGNPLLITFILMIIFSLLLCAL